MFNTNNLDNYTVLLFQYNHDNNSLLYLIFELIFHIFQLLVFCPQFVLLHLSPLPLLGQRHEHVMFRAAGAQDA